MTYIGGSETAIEIVWASALGASIRWRGCRHGLLFGTDQRVIGSYHPYVTGRGWSIHTEPYGGFAEQAEVELVPCKCR
jgi:hypothetical protein